MKRRRRIARPQAQDYVTRQLQQGIALRGMRFRVTSQSSNRELPIVAFGSKASFLTLCGDVRFTPESDQLLRCREMTLCAISDQSAVQQMRLQYRC